MESSGIGVALIGAGKAAESWYLPELSATGARIAVIASRRPFTKTHAPWLDEPPQAIAPGPDVWMEAIARADVDAVIVATPNHLHADVAASALAHRRHVLVEKPLCRNSEEARALVTMARRRPDLVAAVAYKHRYLPTHARAKEIILEGQLGEPTKAHARMAHRGPKSWSPESDWFTDRRRACGGALLDLGVHKLDTCTWLLDERVCAAEANVGPIAGDTVEDRAVATFHLGSGCPLLVEASWAAEIPVDDTRIEFTNGWLHLDGKTRLTWSVGGNAPVVEVHQPPANGAGFADSGVTRAFIRAASGHRNWTRELASFEVGANHVAAIEAAYISSGSRASIPDDLR